MQFYILLLQVLDTLRQRCHAFFCRYAFAVEAPTNPQHDQPDHEQ